MLKKELVSVIITTKNEGAVLRRLLRSIKDQLHKNIEIIVVDNNSIDNTKKIALEFTRSVYNFWPEMSAQRNHGAKKSKGKYLIFLDADMELTKNVVKDCMCLMNSDKKMGGAVIPEKSIARSYWEKVKAFEREFYNEHGDPITDAARFFKKNVFVSVGGYDEKITGPEDWDFPETVKKAGFRIGRISSQILHHERISSPINLAKKKYYYALCSPRYLKKHSIPIWGPKTVYFLRPVFYKNMNKFIEHPTLFLGMSIMLTLELLGGGLGYLMGRVKRVE